MLLEIGRLKSAWKMAAIVYLPTADLVAPLSSSVPCCLSFLLLLGHYQ